MWMQQNHVYILNKIEFSVDLMKEIRRLEKKNKHKTKCYSEGLSANVSATNRHKYPRK